MIYFYMVPYDKISPMFALLKIFLCQLMMGFPVLHRICKIILNCIQSLQLGVDIESISFFSIFNIIVLIFTPTFSSNPLSLFIIILCFLYLFPFSLFQFFLSCCHFVFALSTVSTFFRFFSVFIYIVLRIFSSLFSFFFQHSPALLSSSSSSCFFLNF